MHQFVNGNTFLQKLGLTFFEEKNPAEK